MYNFLYLLLEGYSYLHHPISIQKSLDFKYNKFHLIHKMYSVVKNEFKKYHHWGLFPFSQANLLNLTKENK